MRRILPTLVLGSALVATAVPAAPDLASLKIGDPIPGRYIVVLEDAATLAGALGLAGTPAGKNLAETIVNTLGADIAAGVTQVYGNTIIGFAAPLSDSERDFLVAHPLVDYVEQDQVVGIGGVQQNATWGLDRSDARSGLDSVYSWDTDGTGVHAYILDTGIRASHQEFAGRIGEGADFSGETGFFGGGGGGGGGFFGGGGGLFGGGDPADEPYAPSDCNGHGTHVAGTVGGTQYGMAKNVTIHAVRVLGCGGVGSSSNAIAGLDWVVANGMRPAVVNMSLGGSASNAEDQAVERTVAAGITVVVAAGNDDVDACTGSPARAASAITVASTDRNDARSGFSNWGECVDIFAPGGSIVSASYLSNSGSTTMSGTSMAAPHVAGAAALILSGGGATPADVAARLEVMATAGAVRDPAGSPNLLLYNGGGNVDVGSGGGSGGDTGGETGGGGGTVEEPVPGDGTDGGSTNPGKGGGKGRKK